MKSIEVLHPTVRHYFVPDGFVVEQASIWYRAGWGALTKTYQTIIDLMLAGF